MNTCCSVIVEHKNRRLIVEHGLSAHPDLTQLYPDRAQFKEHTTTLKSSSTIIQLELGSELKLSVYIPA